MTAGRIRKFMLTVNDPVHRGLEGVARRRGLTVQELIRTIVIPEWMVIEHAQFPAKESSAS